MNQNLDSQYLPNQYLDAFADAAARCRQNGLTRTADDGQNDGVRIDLASNDYLGLRRHPTVLAGAREALEQHGAYSSPARTWCTPCSNENWLPAWGTRRPSFSPPGTTPISRS